MRTSSLKRISSLITLIILFSLASASCQAVEGLFPTTAAPVVTPTTIASSPTRQVGQKPSPQPTAPPTSVTSCPILTAQERTQLDEIEQQVVTLRGLHPLASVERTMLTRDQLHQQVIDEFLSDYSQEDAQDEARLLSLLGLLPADFDLWTFYTDLYSEQIAGYYNDETEEMALICGSNFGGPQRLIFAHEYTHALQDQTYDLEEGLGYSEEACESQSERCAAIQALVEGDATLLENQWWQIYATQEDWDDLVALFSTLETPVLDSAPRFMRENLLFPYMAGQTFVRTLYQEGGWAAVDAAYENPPLSTEQILHPERYPSDMPVSLITPDPSVALSAPWRPLEPNVLGEWFTQLTLNEYLPKADAVEAAEGWAGDYYLAFYHEDADLGALVLVTQWDTMRDVLEFSAAFLDYGDARFEVRKTSAPYEVTWSGDAGFASFERQSNQTRWVLAPNAETAELLRQALPFPAKPQ
jgi:hypothetical protein